MTLAPLTWTSARAGVHTATDRDGNTFLIRKTGRDAATGHGVWSVFVNDQFQTTEFGLARGKRYVEGIARKHSSALRSREQVEASASKLFADIAASDAARAELGLN